MKSKRVVRVESVEFGENLSILTVGSLDKLLELQQPREWLLETDNDFLLLKSAVVFRFIKPNSMPQILHAQNFWLSPDSYRAKIELSTSELLSMAKKERIPLFETTSEFIAPGDIVLVAQKPKEKSEEKIGEIQQK